MESQNLTPEFLAWFKTFATETHDNRNGLCKCGETHTPYEFQKLAASEFKKVSGT